MKNKIKKLQVLLQEESNRLGLNYKVIVTKDNDGNIYMACYDPETMSETEGWYQTWDNFFGESERFNLESVFTTIYLASLYKLKSKELNNIFTN